MGVRTWSLRLTGLNAVAWKGMGQPDLFVGKPGGVAATMVWTSFSLLLRTFSEKPVRPFTSGPSIDHPYR